MAQLNKILNELQSSKQQRSFAVDTRNIDEDARTVELAFSSETDKVERWFGIEVLDHKPESVRLERLNDGGALLSEHNSSNQIGVIESAKIDKDGVGRATVRFSKNNPKAEQEFRDVVDGIRRHVSVGYRVHEAVLEKEDADGPNTYRITDWEPYEVSLVSIPADPSVGVGRGHENDAQNVVPLNTEEKKTMTTPVEKTPSATPAPVVNVEAAQQEARAAERQRITDITEMGRKFSLNEDAQRFINEGSSVEQFNRHVLGCINQPKPVELKDKDPNVGMDKKEIKRYSIMRAINAAATGNWGKAGLEREASLAMAEKMGRDARGFFIPHDVLSQRDLSVGTATAGGNLVGTNLMAGDFISLLRNRMALAGAGSRVMTGLVGDMAIPRQTGGATASWVAEDGDAPEQDQTFDQVPLSPKSIAAYTEITRKLMLQSTPDADDLVMTDLMTALALGIDLAGIAGTGTSNQPTGILNTTGIGDVAGGTNGLAPAWSHIVDLESEVSIDNADVGSLRYLTNASVRGALKKTEKASGTAQFIMGSDNGLNGYETTISNQVPNDLDKGTSTGVCSAIIFGNFNDLIIGLWSGIDITVNPYSNDIKGKTRIVAFQDADVAVRHPQSFAAMQDALTA